MTHFPAFPDANNLCFILVMVGNPQCHREDFLLKTNILLPFIEKERSPQESSVLAIWDIRSEKPEMYATKSRTDKPLLHAYTRGYLGNQAEIWRLLFVREGKYQHVRSS